MALCPYCGAPLPLTLEVREAEKARAAVPELSRPQPMLDTGAAQAPERRSSGWTLWILLLFAIGAAAALWRLAPTLHIAP